MSAPKKVVLAYSGGLDTSIILKWLQTEYGCEVVTFTADLGQGEELEPARAKAEMMGAAACYIEDVREEFVRDFVFPMFRANALYEGLYLLGTSIARPLISKRLVEIAAAEGADAVDRVLPGEVVVVEVGLKRGEPLRDGHRGFDAVLEGEARRVPEDRAGVVGQTDTRVAHPSRAAVRLDLKEDDGGSTHLSMDRQRERNQSRQREAGAKETRHSSFGVGECQQCRCRRNDQIGAGR